jgi:hypothetical protein
MIFVKQRKERNTQRLRKVLDSFYTVVIVSDSSVQSYSCVCFIVLN